MSKNILVISTSLRPGSNSDLLAQHFAQGAREGGHEVEVLSLRGKELRFCNYGMSGQMKTLLDRANSLYSADYTFRDIYLLAAAAEEDPHTVDGTVTSLTGWVDCFEKARLAGTVFAGGVNAPGAVQGHPALEQAYELGKHL